jgi:DNA/RNA endonuclease YhcR with UshA esterase domain
MKWMAVAVFMCFTVAQLSAQTFPPKDLSQHVGETVITKGTVDEVHTSNKGNTFLNFGGSYPQQAFTAFIPVRNAAMFPDVHALQGKTVEVSGRVALYKGKPEIVLESPSQLRTE